MPCVLPTRAGADAQPLQLGRRHLVADVERLGDQRRLLELRCLDAREWAAIGDAAGLCRSGDQLRIDLLSRKRVFDDSLALLDQPGASFGGGGKARRRNCCEARTRHQPSGCIARPADEPEQGNKKHRLKRCGNAKAAKLGPVMDEQIAIAENPRRRGQHLRHTDPAPPTARAESASPVSSRKGAPQPLPTRAVAPPHIGTGDTAFGWLTISTSIFIYRDESSDRCGELPESAASGWIRAKSSCCAAQHAPVKRIAARIFRGALRAPHLPLEAPPGHAVPTRRVLSARRVEMTEVVTAGADVRPAKPATKPRVLIFLPVPAPSRPAGARTSSTPKCSAARIGRSSARPACSIAST